MSTRNSASASDVIASGARFVLIMVFWIIVTAVVYGAFVLVWPTIPEAEPWVHLGVYTLPLIGYIGHIVQHARFSHTE